MFNGGMTHPTVPQAKPQVNAKHPFKNVQNHQKLVEYIQQRLVMGKQMRDNKLPRMKQVDQDVAGWMRLSEADRERQRKQQETGTPQAITMNLPLTFVHIDDMMTYFAQTFSPNKGMFEYTGNPEEAPQAAQIVTLMNNHAIYSGAYRQTLLTILSCLKYNIGGFHGYWSKDVGPKLKKPTDDATPLVTTETLWQGNKVESLDMYNTFWDPSVAPSELHKEGEFAARASMRSHFWLANKCQQGIYFNCAEALEQDVGVSKAVYYRSPPAEAKLLNQSPDGTDWVSILSETPEYVQQSGFELVETHIRLNPLDFGLLDPTAENRATRNRLEVWRVTLLNDKYIIDATFMNNIHNYLPFFLGLINDDLMAASQKSVAEILKPLQDFASFLLNTHVRAVRKNIWGLTIYDPSMVDLNAIPEGEVSAQVPLKPTGYGKDVRTAVWQNQNVLDTKQTMQDLDGVMSIINNFFPTQSLPSQIASIDRAVDSQVAAVQQGANRRMQKTARLLDDSLFRPLRFAFYYNIIQYQADGASVTDFYGKTVTVDLAALRETDLPFIIGQGLKAIDKQASAQALQQLIFAIIQNPVVAQQVDLLGLIDYWTTMINIDVDMRQFHIKQQAAPGVGHNGGPPLDPAAEQAETGAPITAMNPLAMTAPIRRSSVDAPAS